MLFSLDLLWGTVWTKTTKKTTTPIHIYIFFLFIIFLVTDGRWKWWRTLRGRTRRRAKRLPEWRHRSRYGTPLPNTKAPPDKTAKPNCCPSRTKLRLRPNTIFQLRPNTKGQLLWLSTNTPNWGPTPNPYIDTVTLRQNSTDDEYVFWKCTGYYDNVAKPNQRASVGNAYVPSANIASFVGKIMTAWVTLGGQKHSAFIMSLPCDIIW